MMEAVHVVFDAAIAADTGDDLLGEAQGGGNPNGNRTWDT